ncbi:MAG: hydrolase 1, exosortase A system-associated, partial [Pseudomonadota bacterium]|nr:hydrolase 1, exosortase A system-associated [Pseudomonadota bacterium]
MTETAFVFACRGDELPGILHHGAAGAARGLLLVVGGPQYRVGSHRQFVLLARDLAAAGIPVLRFDYRGMGDAGGDFAGFEGVDDDIAAALDAFFARCPGLREVVLWGLCDAAS